MIKISRIIKKVMTLTIALFILFSAPSLGAPFTIPDSITINDNTFLPLRYAAENSGYTIDWNGESQTVKLTKEKNNITILLKDNKAIVDGKTIFLEVAPKVIDGNTYIPIDFFDFFSEWYITETGEKQFTFIQRSLANPDNMYKAVDILSQNPRGPNNPEKEIAQNFIISEFKKYGLNVQTQEFEYEYFDWSDGSRHPKKGMNIIGTILPNTLNKTNDIIILGAHYDGVDDVPAANDNASGVSVILELARILSELPTDTEIRFIAFDAEEEGLKGSQAYVEGLDADMKNIIGMFNFDMLAAKKADKVEIFTADGNENYLSNILKNNYKFSDIDVRVYPIGSSDHMSFYPKATPTIFFSHPLIWGEYHNENDIIDHIDKDKLLYAAETAFVIMKNIISDQTPSFEDLSRPTLDNKIYSIPKDIKIPNYAPKSKIEKELGIKLTQVVSDDRNSKYQAKIRFLDFGEPLILTYEGTANYLISPHIDLSDTGITLEQLKGVLNDAFGAITEHSYNNEHDLKIYSYNSIYGNTYTIHYDQSESMYTLHIDPYEDNNKEGYTIENGELVRMEYAEPVDRYELTKRNGKVIKNEQKNIPSKTLGVSENAQKCWQRIKPLLSAEELSQVTFITLSSDGIGGDNPIRFENFKSDARAETIVVEQLEEGESLSYSELMGEGIQITIDYMDLLNPLGSSYTDKDFIKNFAISYAPLVATVPEQIVSDSKFPVDGTVFEKAVFEFKKSSYLYQFTKKFWYDIIEEHGDNIYLMDLYDAYPDNFVHYNASPDPYSDFSYCFGEFISEDMPTGNSIIDQKIKFFYNYPELIQLKERLLGHIN